MPFIDEKLILGGFYTPGAGVVDSLRAARSCASARRRRGLTVSANTEVLGIDVEGGRVRRVRTTRGDIETERVVIALRRMEPAARADGGRVDPADADGPPDDRHRPRAAVR